MIKVGLINEFSGDMLEHIAGLYIHAGWIGKDDDTAFLLPALKGSALVAGAFDEEGKIIGSARVLSDGCSDAYIQDVVVDPAYRGQGIGSQFLNYIEAEYPKAIFRLEVEAENECAVHVYQKCGYGVLPYMEMKK